MAAYQNAPVIELKEQNITNEDGIKEHVWNSKSPFLINDMSIEQHEEFLRVADEGIDLGEEGTHRRGLYNTTE